MSRNKENFPPRSPTAVTNSFPSDDFFTDSILDASSAYPTPNPIKTIPDKSRRILGPPLPLKRRRTSPLRNGLTSTPPPIRRSATLLTSPKSDVSSPPRGLEDTYQRIADEEDLAAAERDLESSSEEDVEVADEDMQNGTHTDQEEQGEDAAQNNVVDGQQDVASQHSTPVPVPAEINHANGIPTELDNVSDVSGMSFLEQLTDQALAVKMTPHTIDRARDRARVNRALQSQLPIAFHTAKKFEGNGVHRSREHHSPAVEVETPPSVTNLRRNPVAFGRSNGFLTDKSRRANSEVGLDSLPVRKIPTAFSRAGKITRRSPAVEDGDESDTPPELRDREKVLAFSRASRVLTGTHKKPQNTTNGFSATDRDNEDRSNGRRSPVGSSASSVRSHQSEPTMSTSRSGPVDAAAARDYFMRMREKKRSLRNREELRPKPVESSQIDWAAAASADIPLPSIEPVPALQPIDNTDTDLEQPTEDRVRKWDNDFTGLSFQVSESPVVRNKISIGDTYREKEIQHLSKRALTTSRLEEIPERSPDAVRKASPLSTPRTAPVQDDSVDRIEENHDREMSGLGQQIPDTPVVVYRSSSSMDERQQRSSSRNRPVMEPRESLNQMQRLAKAMRSSSSPSPGPDSKPAGGFGLEEPATSVQEPLLDDVKVPSKFTQQRGDRVDMLNDHPKVVAETPRVVGAWTDTILQDTIKTVKQRDHQPKYLHTPHVSAGAWTDTPILTGKRQSSALAPMTIDEITEEIEIANKMPVEPISGINAIPIPPVEESAIKAEQDGNIPRPPPSHPSALGTLLDRQKQKRLASQDITTAFESNDTLNLGDATIESLEDLLSLNATDMTTLLRLGEENFDAKANPTVAESELLERLGTKLERLRNNIHDARKGISKLEREVSAPAADQKDLLLSNPNNLLSLTSTCQICGHSSSESSHDHIHTHSNLFPVLYSTFTLPIPLLFHPRRHISNSASTNPKTRPSHKFLRQIPRPTVLGWLTILLWSWYLIEITLSEIYSHPLHAEKYTWPIDPEPVFPWVLPTMVGRWTGFDSWGMGMGMGIWGVGKVGWRIGKMVLGGDGFVDDTVGRSTAGQGTNVLNQVVKESVKAMVGVVTGDDIGGMGMGMGDDEFI